MHSFIANTKQVVLALIALALCQITKAENDPYTVELYETYCVSCHSIAGANIPVAFDEEAWKNLIQTKGIEGLVNAAITGIGNMPAQGLCQECAYEDFEGLIAYMSKATKP